MPIGDVTSIAYAAAVGAPPAPATGNGARCGRCGFAGAVMTPVRKVVSKLFTAYAGWFDPRNAELCEACVWLYRHPPLRTAIHCVRRTKPSLTSLTEHALGQLLSEPLAQDVALIVPSHMGRKHVFAGATWGRIAVDDAQLAWTGRDVEMLAAMSRLRTVGFSERALLEPAPKFAVLQKLPNSAWPTIFEDWETLNQWRSAPPWWAVATRAASGVQRTRGFR